MIADYLILALRNLRNRKTRTWLTILGILIGIAAVISLVSLGQGLQQAIVEQFESVGSDVLIIQAKGLAFGPPGSYTVTKLTKDDVDVITRTPGISLVAARILRAAKIEFNRKSVYTYVASIPTGDGRRLIEQTGLLKIGSGRLLNDYDKYKVVIGGSYGANPVFDRIVKVNDKLLINGKQFTVVGILQKGNPELDDAFLLPEQAMRDTFNIPEDVDVISARVTAGSEPNAVAVDVEKALRRSRGVKVGKEDFKVQTAEQLLNTFNSILGIVTAVIIGIAAISLVVGSVGIMNTMYTAVVERTREIGIMKAIGATNRDVMLLFVIESGLLGMAGGLLGIAIGGGVSKLVEVAAAYSMGPGLLKSYLPAEFLIGALLFSFLIGAGSGVFPALQAAKMKPVDALRGYE